MKPAIKPSILTATALAVGALAALTARAADVQYFGLRDKSAVAEFESVDTSTCSGGTYGTGIVTHVSVQGAFDAIRATDGTTGTPLANATIQVWDNCRGSQLLLATGFTTNFVLQIDANLKKASLKARIDAWDEASHNTVTVDVDLVWSAISKDNRDTFNDVTHDPGLTIASHSQGTIRDAAASGSVKIGTTDYTPDPSITGYIQKNAFHEVTITH